MEPINLDRTDVADVAEGAGVADVGGVVDEQSLHGMWERTARRIPDSALMSCALLGVLGLGMVPFVGTQWWLVSPLFAAGGFGGWGIADREERAHIAEGVTPPPRLRAIKAICMTVGAAGLAVMGLTALVVIVAPLIAGGWR